jgi:hypothetical protein
MYRYGLDDVRSVLVIEERLGFLVKSGTDWNVVYKIIDCTGWPVGSGRAQYTLQDPYIHNTIHISHCSRGYALDVAKHPLPLVHRTCDERA